jgi:hypothetical protein
MDAKFDLRLVEAMPARAKLTELARLPRLVAFFDHQIRQNQGPCPSV